MDASVEAAVADAHRREWAFVLAATVRVAGDIDLAEECVQDAYARALTAWPDQGVPARPGAWLTTVARRRAIDVLRRRAVHDRVLPELLVEEESADPVAGDRPDVPDDRLRLVFTCCHPALAPEARVALTLRLVCGLTTPRSPGCSSSRSRPWRHGSPGPRRRSPPHASPTGCPASRSCPERTDAVLTVVHLVFTTGHTAPVGADLVRADLAELALSLARMLRLLLPDDADVAGLLGLILLTHARRSTRVSEDGSLALLSDQDRSRWDADGIAEGLALVREALTRRPPGRFALMAAIAAVHAEAPTWSATDWAELVGLYDLLVGIWPSPVVALNRAVAVGFADGPEAGLAALDRLADEPQLATYAYLPSARAGLLARLGRYDEAAVAYRRALDLTDNAVERRVPPGAARRARQRGRPGPVARSAVSPACRGRR